MTAIRLVDRALELAAADMGKVVEVGGNNHGPAVERMLAAVWQPAGQPWCAAWIYDLWSRAARDCGGPNPCPRTASVWRLWELGEKYRVAHPLPGDVFVHLEKGKGHTGLVTQVLPNHLVTIDGNTTAEHDPNDPAGRDGGGVYRKTRRREYFSGFLRFDQSWQEDPTVPMRVG